MIPGKISKLHQWKVLLWKLNYFNIQIHQKLFFEQDLECKITNWTTSIHKNVDMLNSSYGIHLQDYKHYIKILQELFYASTYENIKFKNSNNNGKSNRWWTLNWLQSST